MSGSAIEAVKQGTLARLAMNQVEEESVSLAQAVTIVFRESSSCDCDKCVVVRQARSLLRLLGKEQSSHG